MALDCQGAFERGTNSGHLPYPKCDTCPMFRQWSGGKMMLIMQDDCRSRPSQCWLIPSEPLDTTQAGD